MSSRVKAQGSVAPLTERQLAILKRVYTYRFVSRDLLADSLAIDAMHGLYRRLEVLVKHGYIGRRFDKKQRLQHLPVAYYLTPRGMAALKSLSGYSFIRERDIQESYRDKSVVSRSFIDHQLDICRQTQRLQKQYPSLKVFTSRYMRQYSYFPKLLPDAFLSLSRQVPHPPSRYFLDVIDSSLSNRGIAHKLACYIAFFESGEWYTVSSKLPVVLLSCSSGRIEKSMQQLARSILHRFSSGLAIYTCTTESIEVSTATSIWRDVSDTSNLHKLGDS